MSYGCATAHKAVALFPVIPLMYKARKQRIETKAAREERRSSLASCRQPATRHPPPTTGHRPLFTRPHMRPPSPGFPVGVGQEVARQDRDDARVTCGWIMSTDGGIDMSYRIWHRQQLQGSCRFERSAKDFLRGRHQVSFHQVCVTKKKWVPATPKKLVVVVFCRKIVPVVFCLAGKNKIKKGVSVCVCCVGWSFSITSLRVGLDRAHGPKPWAFLTGIGSADPPPKCSYA